MTIVIHPAINFDLTRSAASIVDFRLQNPHWFGESPPACVAFVNKAAGEDGIQAEILIADSQTAAEVLHTHIEEQMHSWTKGLLVKLPKKGDLRDCGNSLTPYTK